MKNLYIFAKFKPPRLFTFIFLLMLESANANLVCSALFQTSFVGLKLQTESQKPKVKKDHVKKFEVPKLQPYSSGLSVEKLKAQNLKIDKNGVLWDTRDSMMLKLGTIKVIETDKLYQWAESSYHKEIMEAGGITASWMKVIISHFGQAAGKGFYVSTHPFDSASYGTAVTVFELRRPLYLFETGPHHEGFNSNYTIYSEDFVLRAQAAGIHGLRTLSYRQSWIAIISPQALKTEDLTSFLEYGVSESYNRYLKRSIRFLKDQLSETDKNRAFYKVITKQPLNPKEIASLLADVKQFQENERLQIYKELKRNLFEASDLSQFNEVFAIIKTTAEDSATTDEFINGVYPTSANKNVNLKMGVLDIFDLKTIAQLKNISDSTLRLKALQEFFEAAHVYNQGLSTNFQTIKTVPDLMSFASKVYGNMSYKTRDYDVVMAFDSEGSIVELPLSELAYSRIKSNPNLQVYLKRTSTQSDGQKLKVVEVAYANPEQYLSLFKFGPETKNWSQNKIISAATKKLLAALINPNQHQQMVNNLPRGIFDRCKLFLSLHPFEDGNGRFSRLLYLIMGNVQSIARTQRGLTLPMYDLDLFLDFAEFKQQIQIGAMMKAWVSGSTTPEMFIERSQVALDMLKKLYPHLASLID